MLLQKVGRGGQISDGDRMLAGEAPRPGLYINQLFAPGPANGRSVKLADTLRCGSVAVSAPRAQTPYKVPYGANR